MERASSLARSVERGCFPPVAEGTEIPGNCSAGVQRRVPNQFTVLIREDGAAGCGPLACWSPSVCDCVVRSAPRRRCARGPVCELDSCGRNPTAPTDEGVDLATDNRIRFPGSA